MYQVRSTRLKKTESRHVFDLANAPSHVVIDLAVYRSPQSNRPNCHDVVIREVGQPPNPAEVWRALAGTLEVVRGPKGIRPEEPWLFKTTVGPPT
jgi:hypothetical protein